MEAAAIEQSLDVYRHQIWTELADFAGEFDPGLLLGGAAALSQLSIQVSDTIQVPGRFDHEVDTIATSARWIESSTRRPTWDDISTCLKLAQRWRTATVDANGFRKIQVAMSGTRADRAKFDLRLSVLAYWHMVDTGRYTAIVTELCDRLVSLLPPTVISVVEEDAPEILFLLAHLDALTQEHTTRLSRERSDLSFDEAIDDFTNRFDVASAASLLCSERRAWAASDARAYIWDVAAPRDGRYENPLLTRPFLLHDGSTMLVSVRRLTTDLLDLLDRSLMRACRVRGGGFEARYSRARAAMLDRLVADIMRHVFAGCVVSANVVPLTANEPERDVICEYEDVALAIETKGSPLKESALRGSPSLLEDLNKKGGEGARQALSSAEDLRAGIKLRLVTDGSPVPLRRTQLRKAYAMCVSFSSPLPLNVSPQRMCEAGLIPSHAVCLTTIDILMIMASLFSDPGEFLAYLDFRLSVQRRGWFALQDEYEVAGFFCNVTHSSWLVNETQAYITLFYQDAFNAFVRSPATRPALLTRHDSPVVVSFLERLRGQRPAGWLMGVSAAMRTPLDVQEWIQDVLATGLRYLGSRPYRTVRDSGGVTSLTLLSAGVDDRDADLRAQIQRKSATAAISWIVAVAPFRQTVVAIRGVDDHEYWWLT